MKVAIVVHGIRSKGELFFDSVEPWLVELGYVVRRWQYDPVTLLQAYLINDNLATLLAGTIRDLDPKLIVSHSNGACVEHRALHLLDQRGYNREMNLLRISPALNRRAELANCVNRCGVLYTPHDWAVRLARWLPVGIMGAMGAFGPISDDPRFIREEEPKIDGHSEWFVEPQRSLIVKPIAQRIIRQMESTPCSQNSLWL